MGLVSGNFVGGQRVTSTGENNASLTTTMP